MKQRGILKSPAFLEKPFVFLKKSPKYGQNRRKKGNERSGAGVFDIKNGRERVKCGKMIQGFWAEQKKDKNEEKWHKPTPFEQNT